MHGTKVKTLNILFILLLPQTARYFYPLSRKARDILFPAIDSLRGKMAKWSVVSETSVRASH